MTGTAKAIKRITAKLVALLTPPPALNVWQWAAANLDFSRAMNYDTPIHGPFDPDYMPYWKEPAECLTRNDIREIAILKATRAGGSENILLNAVRYAVAMRPQPVLYVTSDQISAERFMDRRIKRSMRCADATAKEYRNAQATQHDVAFPSMDLRATWPRAKQAFKQDGWALVLCDEVSTWPEYSADMARRRTDSYPFPHIVFLSSPDPAQRRASDDDPIFVEYRRGDQRKWMMPDPAGGEFCWTMGKRGEAGVQWDDKARRDDGTWDYDKVEATAWYQTPGGARIENAARVSTTRAGHWVATNPSAPSWCRSYHVNSFMVPFAAGDFGKIAAAFLKAKAAGPMALRGFVYEYLAEPWTQDVERIQDDSITRRVAEYLKGQSYFDLHADYKDVLRGRIMTVDVQKDHFWYLVREWAAGGKSCLVEWGTAGEWDQLDEIATRHKAEAVIVDSGYGERTTEVYDECMRRRLCPAKGDDRTTQPDLPWRRSDINPYEGTRMSKHGAKLGLLLWHTDTFKLMLLARIRGDAPGWFVYRGIERDYRLQVTAEERTPEGWVKRRRDNHLLDCEAMQVAAAAAYGYLAKWDVPAAPPAQV